MDNELTMIFSAVSQNEAFARSAVAAFLLELNPTVEEVNDVKTAVSEAVTNSVVHGYENDPEGKITLCVKTRGNTVHITVTDHGVGIEDIDRARQPFFTTKPDADRSGMGFTVMETVMDSLTVSAAEHGGVQVEMTKAFGAGNAAA